MLPDAGGNGRQAPQRSSGSGFIVSANGEILTNNHVVEGADRLLVTLYDRRIFPAKVIGRDPATDVALIKIEATGLPTLPLGDDGPVQVGQPVLAIGAPARPPLHRDRRASSARRSAAATSRGLFGARPRRRRLPPDRRGHQPRQLGRPAHRHGRARDRHQQRDREPDGRLRRLRLRGAGQHRPHRDGPVPQARPRAARDPRRLDHATSRRRTRVAAGLKEIRGALVGGFSGEDSAAERAGLKQGDVIVSVDGKPISSVATLQRIDLRLPPGPDGHARLRALRHAGHGARHRCRRRRRSARRSPAPRAPRADIADRHPGRPSSASTVEPLTPQLASELRAANERARRRRRATSTRPARRAAACSPATSSPRSSAAAARSARSTTGAQLAESVTAAPNGVDQPARLQRAVRRHRRHPRRERAAERLTRFVVRCEGPESSTPGPRAVRTASAHTVVPGKAGTSRHPTSSSRRKPGPLANGRQAPTFVGATD